MSSEFGNKIKVGVFGQSHGRAIGVTVHGLPAGEEIDLEELQEFMERRRGGRNAMSTTRSEADRPEFLSGLENGRTCAAPLCAVIENTNTRSGDYDELKYKPRPGHADYTAFVKWDGEADMRGGGHFSGRLTAPLCIAGGIAKQILARRGIHVGAHLYQVAGINDDAYPMIPGKEVFDTVSTKEFPVISDEKGALMQQKIAEASADGDSVGGIIECVAVNVPAGIGSPIFDGLENTIAQLVFGIPAVKGLEFGAGFKVAEMVGSQNNDSFYVDDHGYVKTHSNNHGGILGGISSGMPITMRVAIKPTASIGVEQDTVNMSTMQNDKLVVHGRHDPCIVARAVPCVEAAMNIALLSHMLDYPHFTE